MGVTNGAGHIFKATIGLSPVAFLAEDLGNMLSNLIPMSIDSALNRKDVFLCNVSFSDGNGQNFNCISERMRGRQQNMTACEKKLEAAGSASKILSRLPLHTLQS